MELSRAPDLQLPDRVARHLRDLILSGAVRPGEFLRIDRLAERFEVSPTPVREALQSLRAEDMVRLAPRRGYVVAPLSRADIVDLFAVQAHLTGELAARAAARLGAADVAGLRDLAQRVDDELAGSDPDALVDAEHAFHAAVNRAADSRKIAWLVGRAAHYLPPRFYATHPEWAAATPGAHAALLDALGAGDPDAAREAMDRHVADGRDLLLAHLDRTGMWADADTDPDPTGGP